LVNLADLDFIKIRQIKSPPKLNKENVKLLWLCLNSFIDDCSRDKTSQTF